MKTSLFRSHLKTQQDDGIMNNRQFIIEVELWRFKNITYHNGVKGNSAIIFTYDSANLLRMWTFTIKRGNLSTNLVLNAISSQYLVYKGYFWYRFKIVDIQQAFINFNFEVLLEKAFQNVKADDSLKFCKTPGQCDELSDTINLYLDQEFSLMQKITSPAFTNKFLILKAVYIFGKGLNRKIPPTAVSVIINSELAQVIQEAVTEGGNLICLVQGLLVIKIG